MLQVGLWGRHKALQRRMALVDGRAEEALRAAAHAAKRLDEVSAENRALRSALAAAGLTLGPRKGGASTPTGAGGAPGNRSPAAGGGAAAASTANGKAAPAPPRRADTAPHMPSSAGSAAAMDSKTSDVGSPKVLSAVPRRLLAGSAAATATGNSSGSGDRSPLSISASVDGADDDAASTASGGSASAAAARKQRHGKIIGALRGLKDKFGRRRKGIPGKS